MKRTKVSSADARVAKDIVHAKLPDPACPLYILQNLLWLSSQSVTRPPGRINLSCRRVWREREAIAEDIVVGENGTGVDGGRGERDRPRGSWY